MFRNPLIDFGVLLLAVLLIFGPKRLPSLGRGLGQGMKEFKEGITGKSAPIEDEAEDRPALGAANSGQPAAGSAPVSTPASEGTEPSAAEVGSTEPRS
jgi:sec-independent protein translocase protein TatA